MPKIILFKIQKTCSVQQEKNKAKVLLLKWNCIWRRVIMTCLGLEGKDLELTCDLHKINEFGGSAISGPVLAWHMAGGCS